MEGQDYKLGSNPNVTKTEPVTTSVKQEPVVETVNTVEEVLEVKEPVTNAASFAAAVKEETVKPAEPTPAVKEPVVEQEKVEAKIFKEDPKIVINTEAVEEKIVEVQKVISAGEVKLMKGVDKSIKAKLLTLQKNKIANNRKVTLDFTLYHSGYTGKVIAMSFGELNKYKASAADAYEKTNALYRLIYDHIVSTSIFEDGSVPDYVTWLKITSYMDINSLIHALYSRTYPKPSQYSIKCNNLIDIEDENGISTRDVCDMVTKVEIAPTNLTIVRDDKVAISMMEIIHDSSNKEELLKKSKLNIIKRISVSDGMFVDIKAPSLHKFLKHLKEFKQDDINTYEALVNFALFTGAVLYPVEDPNTGEVTYLTDTSIEGIFNDYYYQYVTDEDITKIEAAMVSFTEKHAVTFKTPPVKCEACGQVIDAQDIDVDYLFFRKIESI